MLYSCYLKNGVVYVPTVVQLKTGAYTDVEPVAVLPITNTDGLRRAFLDAIAKKNVIVSAPKGKWPAPVLLKYAGVKTWPAFVRGASSWSIEEEDGIYRIVGYRTHPKAYWEEDPDQKIEFPPDTTVDTVIARMIAILQDAARP
jgi:hypothetical protein